jgi:hypothetical protein
VRLRVAEVISKMVNSLPGISAISTYLPSVNKTGAAAPDLGSPDFSKQLSDLISQSLKTSGGVAGELRVRVEEDKTGGTGKQIVISYSPITAPVAPAVVSPAVPAGNPFSPPPSGTPVLAQPKPETTPWSTYDGPRDRRDQVPAGGGQQSATGSPVIKLNDKPARNQYNYGGIAACNPYFTTPSNPMRDGYVMGFQNWFEDNTVSSGSAGEMRMNRISSASADGAAEALRLVQQYYPDATIGTSRFGEDGGPYAAAKPTYDVVLPDGRKLNAGGLLNSYYNQGWGVNTQSDRVLESVLKTA